MRLSADCQTLSERGVIVNSREPSTFNINSDSFLSRSGIEKIEMSELLGRHFPTPAGVICYQSKN